MSTTVFISHSHRDRKVAVTLEQALGRQKVKTFLDQDHLDAGDELPQKLRNGIESCDKFLLLWSAAASASGWVQNEWNHAYDKRKRIIPYRLDSTTMPEPLDSLVFVDASDRQRGHAQLLTAILGKDFRAADPSHVIPGRWKVTMSLSGLGDVTYDLKLHANGQISGDGHMGGSGIMGGLIAGVGMMNMTIRCQGNWTYDDIAKRLELDLEAEFGGKVTREAIQMSMSGNEKQVSGKDALGRVWHFKRVG
jgi:hypothetical protein